MSVILDNDYIRNNFNVDYIRKLSDDHLNHKTDNARKIYLLYVLALWHEVFIKAALTFS